MRYLIDAQLPPQFAGELRRLGYESVALREVGLRDAEDNEIWLYAITHEFVIVTKDEDFSEKIIFNKPSPQIVWIRVGNCSNENLFQKILPLWSMIQNRLLSGELLIEIN